MSAFGFHILKRIAGLGHLLHKVDIGFVEEVGVAATDPQHSWLLAEVLGKLLIEIVVHRAHLLLIHSDCCREHS